MKDYLASSKQVVLAKADEEADYAVCTHIILAWRLKPLKEKFREMTDVLDLSDGDSLRLRRIINGPIHITITNEELPPMARNAFDEATDDLFAEEKTVDNVLDELDEDNRLATRACIEGKGIWDIGPTTREPVVDQVSEVAKRITLYVLVRIWSQLKTSESDSPEMETLIPRLPQTRITVAIREADENDLTLRD